MEQPEKEKKSVDKKWIKTLESRILPCVPIWVRATVDVCRMRHKIRYERQFKICFDPQRVPES
jgi:hypothetical protein